jgi:hypothetical protein
VSGRECAIDEQRKRYGAQAANSLWHGGGLYCGSWDVDLHRFLLLLISMDIGRKDFNNDYRFIEFD